MSFTESFHRHVTQRAKDLWRHGTLKARSPHWLAFCKEQEAKPGYKGCIACGTRNEVEWHHVRPFHLYPELELDPSNVVPLCMDRKPGGTVRECHFNIGHKPRGEKKANWKTNNPFVQEDAQRQMADIVIKKCFK